MVNSRHSETPRIGLVIADVDGTLVTPRKILTEGSRLAVERIHEAGIAFTITSSRPPRGMRMLIEPLRISVPIAGFNGGQFVKPDLSIISREILSADIVESAIRLIESHGLDIWVFCGSDWFVRNLHGPHIDTEEMTVQFLPRLVRNFDNVMDDVAKVVGVSNDHEAVARCEADARKELGERVSASRSQPYYLDVTHPNANKGMVVRRLSEYLNIPADEIATIGDMSNDVLMFASSGLSIAMGNASPEVQRAAQFVTTSNEEEGFANAVEHYILCETASTSAAVHAFCPWETLNMATATVIHEEAIPGLEQSLFLQEVQKPDPFTIVIFGATGDLTSRKLLPALYGLWQARFLPETFAIVGIGRRDKNNDIFREEMRAAIAKSRQDSPAASGGWNGFLDHIFYQRADFTTAEGMQGICGGLKTLEAEQNLPGNRLVYLATDPEYFGPIIEGAARAGIVNEEMKSPWGRVVIEKPFGYDLKSAMELDRGILSFLRPDQIYRIDHYLGKETVQNLVAFRFGNAIFEPLLDRQYVDHVQITVAETIGMEGRRGAYYDHAGGNSRRGAESLVAASGIGGNGTSRLVKGPRHSRRQA